MKNEGHGGWIIALIIGIIIARFLFPGKYEGETAEYWYNLYDEYVGAYDEKLSQINTKDDCLSDIESESHYYSFDNYDELQDKLDNIESIASNCY